MLYFSTAALEGSERDTTGAGDRFTGYFVASLMRIGSKQLAKGDAVELLRLSVQVCLSSSRQFISTQHSRRPECA